MNKVWRHGLTLLLLLLPLAILTAVIWQLSLFAPAPLTNQTTGDDTGSRITGLRVMQHDGQHLVWVLEAPSAVNRHGQGVFFDQPRLVLYQARGHLTRLHAQQGWVAASGEDALLEGAVEAKDDQNRQLTTESLRFDHIQGILYTEKPFQWRNQNLVLQGVGFRLDQQERKVRVHQKVEAMFDRSRPGAP